MDLWIGIFVSVVGLAGIVWLYINFAGFGKSLRYQLPQPGESRDLSADALPTSPSAPASSPGPWECPGGVAILSPGRNEAEHLPTVLPELCAQDVSNLRVVFIDDASTDDTPAITAPMQQRYSHLLVVRNEDEPPAGWMGKCWALHRGYEALQTSLREQGQDLEWLCFTDADIHWHPQLLRTAIQHAELHEADLLGVTPTLRFGSVGEAIVQLQLVLALGIMLPFEKAMDPDSPVALTGGAFILVRKKIYDQIGGHTAVKGEMVEDLKLGMALKAAGATHRVATAGQLQWCRMYDGWADMWEGLTKNAYAGLNHRWWVAVGVVLAVLLLNTGPAVYAAVSLVWLLAFSTQGPAGLPVAALIVSLLTVLWQARAMNGARKLMNMPWVYAWTMPLGSIVYVAIIVASVWQYHTKGNAWKGRRYSSATGQTND